MVCSVSKLENYEADVRSNFQEKNRKIKQYRINAKSLPRVKQIRK